MKVKIDSYEVEIRAKGYGSTRFNKQDTLSFLCALCVELIYARDSYRERGLTGCEWSVQRGIDNIHSILDENNYNPIK